MACGGVLSDEGAMKAALSAWSLLALGLAPLAPQSVRAETPLHAVLIGGGPDLENNGAQIESHVRFVLTILPGAANRFVHFADGKARAKTVSFTDTAKLSLGRRAMHVLLPNDDFGAPAESRVPQLGVKSDGAALRPDLRRSFGQVAKAVTKSAPVLLYFAGHGSANTSNEENNSYNLWNGADLRVSHLASEIERLPVKAPIALVMVQCYSGAFANVIFRQGDPANDLDDHDIAGFFAATKDRMAAGCGSEIHEPDYQDFSSYFFGALCGRSRLGEPITVADYDQDGSVNMHEAFCFALIHDPSSDTPTCTSDAFLRRFSSVPDAELYATPFEQIRQAATLAQRAALDALSEKLELTGEERLIAAFDRLTFRDPVARTALLQRALQDGLQLNELRQKTLASLFAKWPVLRWSDADAYGEASDEAIRELDGTPALCQEILATSKASAEANAAMENEDAFLLRFTGLCTSIIRGEHLRMTGPEPVKERFEKLCRSEQRTLPLRAR
jgi:hypothetical protein